MKCEGAFKPERPNVQPSGSPPVFDMQANRYAKPKQIARIVNSMKSIWPCLSTVHSFPHSSSLFQKGAHHHNFYKAERLKMMDQLEVIMGEPKPDGVS